MRARNRSPYRWMTSVMGSMWVGSGPTPTMVCITYVRWGPSPPRGRSPRPSPADGCALIHMRPQPTDAFAWVQARGGPALVCRPLEPFGPHLFTSRQWALASVPDGDSAPAWVDVAAAIGADAAHLA